MYRKKQHLRQKNTAQLMIITAFVIAMTFLLLATLLNLVIYAENQAARGLTVAEQSAYETETQTHQTLAGLLSQTNRGTIGNNYSKLNTEYMSGSKFYAGVQKISGSKEQFIIQTTIESTQNGTRLVQDTDRNFTSAGGSTTWTVVDNTSDSRNVSQTIIRDDLLAHTNTSENVDPALLDTLPAFNTKFSDSSGTWEVYVINRSYNNSIYVQVVNPSGNSHGTCEVNMERAELNYSNQSLGKQNCAALDFVENLSSPHDIRYQDADNVGGQYHIHVTKKYGSLSGNFNSGGSGNSPYKAASIYSVTYTHKFTSNRLDYQTTRRVAPHPLREDTD